MECRLSASHSGWTAARQCAPHCGPPASAATHSHSRHSHSHQPDARPGAAGPCSVDSSSRSLSSSPVPPHLSRAINSPRINFEKRECLTSQRKAHRDHTFHSHNEYDITGPTLPAWGREATTCFPVILRQGGDGQQRTPRTLQLPC